MHVTVEDVNEFAPVFREDVYTVTINEGHIIDPIIQVEAFDHDCSSKYSEICKYEITKGNKPTGAPNDSGIFVIDSNGNIKNTRPLFYKDVHNHMIEIVAYDCGMMRSKPTIVNVKINKVCSFGWKGWCFCCCCFVLSFYELSSSLCLLHLFDSLCYVDCV